MASRLFWWMDLARCRKKNSSSEKTGVGKISRRSGVELCECCRVRMKAWLAWLEERLVEWCASTPELDPTYLDRLDWTLFSSGTPSTLTLPAADYGVWWQYDDVGDAPSYTAGAAGNGRYLAQAYGAFPATISGDTSTAEKWTETLAELGWEEIV